MLKLSIYLHLKIQCKIPVEKRCLLGWVGSSRLWQWVEGLMQHFFLNGSMKYGFKQKLVAIISNVQIIMICVLTKD